MSARVDMIVLTYIDVQKSRDIAIIRIWVRNLSQKVLLIQKIVMWTLRKSTYINPEIKYNYRHCNQLYAHF